MNRDVTYCTGEGCPIKDNCARYAKAVVFADIDDYTSWMNPPGFYGTPKEGNGLNMTWLCDYYLEKETNTTSNTYTYRYPEDVKIHMHTNDDRILYVGTPGEEWQPEFCEEFRERIQHLEAVRDRLREALKGLHDVVATEAKFDTVLNRSVHEHLRAARAVLEAQQVE